MKTKSNKKITRSYDLKARLSLLMDLSISAQALIWFSGAFFFVVYLSINDDGDLYRYSYVKSILTVGYVLSVLSTLTIGVCFLLNRINHKAKQHKALIVKSFSQALFGSVIFAIVCAIVCAFLLITYYRLFSFNDLMFFLGLSSVLIIFWFMSGFVVGFIHWLIIWQKRELKAFVVTLLFCFYAWMAQELFFVQGVNVEQIYAIASALLVLFLIFSAILAIDFGIFYVKKYKSRELKRIKHYVSI